MESFEASTAVNYSYLQLAQHIATVVLATHWVACALLLFLKVEVSSDSESLAQQSLPACDTYAAGIF